MDFICYNFTKFSAGVLDEPSDKHLQEVMNMNQNITPQELIDQIEEKWSYPVIPRKKVAEATGYLLSGKTLANEDSLGTGVPGAFMVNGRVCYPTQNLLDWLKRRIEKKQGRNHDSQKI